MYNAKSNSEMMPTGTTGKKIPYGIHTNCSLSSVNVTDSYMDFNYEDPEGRVHNKRVWFPDPTKPPTPKDGESVAEAIQRDGQERAQHITLHLKHINPGDDSWMAVSGASLKAYADNAKRYLDLYKGDGKINLKLTLDKDLQWSEFSRFPTYLERFVDGQEPNLRFSAWELENRSPKAAPSPSNDSPVKYY